MSRRRTVTIVERLKTLYADCGALLRDIATSRLVWGGLFCLSIFWIVAAIARFEHYIPLVHALRFMVAVAATVAYAVGVRKILQRRPIDRLSQITLGVTVAWFAEACLAFGSLWYRLDDTMTWWTDSPIVAFLLYTKTLGGVLHITAPGAIDGQVPTRNWVILAVAIGAAVGLAGFLIGVNWGPTYLSGRTAL